MNISCIAKAPRTIYSHIHGANGPCGGLQASLTIGPGILLSMAGEYHCNDFKWDDLRGEVEADPSLVYHVVKHDSLSSSHSQLHPNPEAWQSFHQRHSTGKFFKERRYLLKEFPELASCRAPYKVLEVGCGNGSTVLPILRARNDTVVYGCDCSRDALELAKENINSVVGLSERFHPILLDLSTSKFPEWLLCHSCRSSVALAEKDVYGPSVTEEAGPVDTVPMSPLGRCCAGRADYVTLIFTLSSVPPQKMPHVIMECFSILKPGSLLLFRDYGLYDMTMLRFPLKQRLGFREYIRSDGTLSYFFSLDVVRQLFLNAGFAVIELEYCCVRSINRSKGNIMRRVWIHGKFQKPV